MRWIDYHVKAFVNSGDNPQLPPTPFYLLKMGILNWEIHERAMKICSHAKFPSLFFLSNIHRIMKDLVRIMYPEWPPFLPSNDVASLETLSSSPSKTFTPLPPSLPPSKPSSPPFLVSNDIVSPNTPSKALPPPLKSSSTTTLPSKRTKEPVISDLGAKKVVKRSPPLALKRPSKPTSSRKLPTDSKRSRPYGTSCRSIFPASTEWCLGCQRREKCQAPYRSRAEIEIAKHLVDCTTVTQPILDSPSSHARQKNAKKATPRKRRSEVDELKTPFNRPGRRELDSLGVTVKSKLRARKPPEKKQRTSSPIQSQSSQEDDDDDDEDDDEEEEEEEEGGSDESKRVVPEDRMPRVGTTITELLQDNLWWEEEMKRVYEGMPKEIRSLIFSNKQKKLLSALDDDYLKAYIEAQRLRHPITRHLVSRHEIETTNDVLSFPWAIEKVHVIDSVTTNKIDDVQSPLFTQTWMLSHIHSVRGVTSLSAGAGLWFFVYFHVMSYQHATPALVRVLCPASVIWHWWRPNISQWCQCPPIDLPSPHSFQLIRPRGFRLSLPWFAIVAKK